MSACKLSKERKKKKKDEKLVKCQHASSYGIESWFQGLPSLQRLESRGAWGGWSWALSFNSLLRFHELSYFLTVIVRHQLLHSIFLVQTYSALSKSQRTFICTKLFVTSNHQFIFTNLQICFNEIYIYLLFLAWSKSRADRCGIFVLKSPNLF